MGSVRTGDLTIRDLGYFALDYFKQIESRSILFIQVKYQNTCIPEKRK